MRVLLTGGGTAGHINPALAIAETVKQNSPDAEIHFVGTKDGKENDLVGRAGYELSHVQSKGFDRSLSTANLKAMYLALVSPYQKQTTKILDEFQPDIVIGTGGFVCWPIMAAAARRGIPTALHESNAKAGLAIKLLQKRVDRIWINFESTREDLKTKKPVLRVGNPIRGAFGVYSKSEARKRLGIGEKETYILSFGGSLGAEPVNEAVLTLMKALAQSTPNLRFLHASGARDRENCQKQFEELGLHRLPNCVLTEYIYDMPTQMAAADLIISRAGAMTLSELAMMKKAAILIPSPHVAANHQYYNAKSMSETGAAILIEESDLPKGKLTETVGQLLSEPVMLKKMEEKIGGVAPTDSNRVIWEQILEMTEENKTKKKD